MDVLKSFLHYLSFEKQFSQHTTQAYETDINQFSNFLPEGLSIENANGVFIRSWMAALAESGNDFKTIKRKLSSLKAFYKYCKLRSIVSANPAVSIKSPKIGKSLPEIIPVTDMKALYRSWELLPQEFEKLRDVLMVILLYETGIRRAELIGLQCDSVNYSRKAIVVLGKGKKVRIIPITNELIDKIQRYLLIRSELFNGMGKEFFLTNSGKPVYPRMVQRIVDRILANYTLVKQRNPHKLRHSFATHLMDSGADIVAIKELLGHSSLNATQIYTHTSMVQLIENYNEFHPRSGSNTK
ncbi:MAG: tyrosine-type recombinase/integrase [Saprospiraceae bacterium]|nr:tyrosine-type recombinase/integrase [Saprospiraceae bacterium]